MDAQFWLVGISNTIHLFATIIWIGWSVLLPLYFAPRVEEAHAEPRQGVALLLRRGFTLALGALALLGATGMLQMGAHPQYEGMFAFTNLWGGLLFAKHLLVLVSAGLIVYTGLGVTPSLRLALRRDALGQKNEAERLAARFGLLAWLNFSAGAGVLLLTGLMTAVH
jgi:uncharacterized membrane protein